MKGHELSANYIWQEPVVYFFEAVDQCLVKVGFSTDPVKRFRQIQTACPFPLRAAALAPGDKAYERELHSTFRYARTSGEWFGIEDEAIDLFARKWRFDWWEIWHDFVRNIKDVRPCPRREISLNEFQALCQYEVELNNPLDRSLL